MQSITSSLLYSQKSPKCTHTYPFIIHTHDKTCWKRFSNLYFNDKYVLCFWQGYFCQQQTQHTYRYTPFNPSFISSDIKEKFFQSVSHDSSFFTEPKEMIIVINLLYLCPEKLEKSPWKLWNPQSLFAHSSVCKVLFFLNQSVLCYLTHVWKGQPHVQISGIGNESCVPLHYKNM